MTAEDDIEAFLHYFEATALAARWGKSQWVTILGPYLSGPAQVLLKTMPASEIGNYELVKAAILDRYEVTPETQRQRFRALRFKAFITELLECATRWLNSLTQGERDIVDKVVLEQVCFAVPSAVHTWMIRVGPTTLDQAAAYLDNYFLAQRAGSKPECATKEKGMDKVKVTGPDPSLIRWSSPLPARLPPHLPRATVTHISSLAYFTVAEHNG